VYLVVVRELVYIGRLSETAKTVSEVTYAYIVFRKDLVMNVHHQDAVSITRIDITV
jgi:ribosomal protein S24E